MRWFLPILLLLLGVNVMMLAINLSSHNGMWLISVAGIAVCIKGIRDNMMYRREQRRSNEEFDRLIGRLDTYYKRDGEDRG